MTSYLVNIIQVIHRNIIYELRNLVNVRQFYAFLQPLNIVSTQFDDFTRQRKRQAKYNGQKMVMERMLNLYYFGQEKWATAADPTASGGFYIEQTSGNVDKMFVFKKTEGSTSDWVFKKSETLPGGASRSFIFKKSELTNLVYDFIVKIPSTFTYNESEVRGLIDRYKPAGKNYAIETY